MAATLRRARGWGEWSVRFGPPPDGAGWVRCSEVSAEYLAWWEGEFAACVGSETGGVVPALASTTYVLKHYAALPGLLGAICFHLARRVPRLDRDAIAFHLGERHRYPARVALLDERFWCLPNDPKADDPAATVLPDEAALAARLRVEVRGHADAFLADYDPTVRLTRRHRYAAFFDGLDQWLWLAGRYAGDDRAGMADAHLVLPGGTAEFPEPSSVHAFVDGHGTVRVSRVRAACCNHYRLPGVDEPCLTCPRVSAEERVRRVADDEEAALASHR